MSGDGIAAVNKIREAREHPDYFGSLVLLDAELEELVALADRVEAAERAERDFARWRTHWRLRAVAAEARVSELEEALRQIMDERPITEDVYDMARAALSSPPPTETPHE